MKIACVVPPIHSTVNEFGHGYMPPLGLLSIAGPLVDAGHDVQVLDADAGHLTHHNVISHLKKFGPKVVLVGHSGSIIANHAILCIIAEIKAALPEVFTVYGGLYPTYAYREIMESEPSVNFIIRGEGEIVALELMKEISKGAHDFGEVLGLVWRDNKEIVVNPLQAVIQDLDNFSVPWSLVDWSLYRSNHIPGHSAVVQFSRGCPHTCSYCGQWMFWREWRQRSIPRFADELQYLHNECDVRTVFIADENWGHDRDLFLKLLEAITARNLKLVIFCAMRAEDVVRDADRIDLYRKAGIACLMLGVESLDETTLERIGKDNPYSTTHRAVELLRQNSILSIVNIIYGLKEETWRGLWRTTWQLRSISPDFYNALHLTPLNWTKEGRILEQCRIIQLDQRKWDFRQPVIQPVNLSPKMLAIGVKISEAVFYFRPFWLLKMLFNRDSKKRRIIIDSIPRTIMVYLKEWIELLQTSYAQSRQLQKPQKHSKMLLPKEDVE